MTSVSSPLERRWEPHTRQTDFARLPFDIFEALYGGALGGGKSELLLMLPIIYQFHEKPGFHGIYFRRTVKQLTESLILRSRELYAPVGGVFNESEHFWRFPRGGVIRFSYLEKDKHARDHDTNEYHYCAFDELTHFSQFQYLYMTSRVRTSRDIPAIVRSATNPGNIGHAWVRKRFVEPEPKGGKLIREAVWDEFNKETRHNLRIFIRATGLDNPHLLAKDPNYYNRLRLLPEAEQRAKIYGDWWVFSGQVFGEFRKERMRGDPENALHVIKPFEIPDWWPKFLAVDWGHTAKTVALGAALAPTGKLFIYKEFVAQGQTFRVWGADLQRIWREEKENGFAASVLDPSAWKEEGHEESIAQQISKATGISFEKALRDRLAGKQLLHEFLRFVPRPPRFIPEEGYDEERAHWIFRNQGDKAYREYKALFLPDVPELNLPRLQIFDDCTELIETIPLCVYQEEKKSRASKKYEDVAEFNGDDAYDCVRYLLQAVNRYLTRVTKEQKSRFERDQVVQSFKEHRDWTKFHRQMEALESRTKNTRQSLTRGRRSFTHTRHH